MQQQLQRDQQVSAVGAVAERVQRFERPKRLGKGEGAEGEVEWWLW